MVIPQHCNSATFSTALLVVFVIWFYPAFCLLDIHLYFIFCALISRSNFLLYHLIELIYIISSTDQSCVQFNIILSRFSSTTVIQYSKAKLKINDYKANPTYSNEFIFDRNVPKLPLEIFPVRASQLLISLINYMYKVKVSLFHAMNMYDGMRYASTNS
jgi:hypothetical protein